MKQIGSLFAKYKKNLKPPQASVEVQAIEVISEVTGINLQTTQITYSPGSKVLRLQVPSVLRTEIIKQKTEIVGRMKVLLGKQHSPVDLL